MIAIPDTMDMELKEFLDRHGILSNNMESESLTVFMLKNHIRVRFGEHVFYLKKFSWSYGFDDFRRFKKLRDSPQFKM